MTVLVGVLASTVGASAHPPEDLVDLVGAKAGQAEGLLEARGYELTAGNNWWSAGEAICVHMSVSQGAYKAIDIVRPSHCGMGPSTAKAGGCPVDVSEADRANYPACN